VTLLPDATLTCLGSYTVTQGDVNAGKVDNTASTTGNPPTGDPSPTPPAREVLANTTPSISLTKTPTESSFQRGR